MSKRCGVHNRLLGPPCCLKHRADLTLYSLFYLYESYEQFTVISDEMKLKCVTSKQSGVTSYLEWKLATIFQVNNALCF